MRWPFVGEFLGGTQRLTPRLQFVASPPTENMDIPNEDARSVDLEDSNLFALNRFPGYDRWEDGVRVTYGADWAVDLPERLVPHHDRPELPARPTARDPAARAPACRAASPTSSAAPTCAIGRFVSLTHRFRIDKDNLALRRNEIDAVVGGRPHLCDDRLFAARPRHRSRDRGSARPRGDQVRRPDRLRPLLVGRSARR